MQTIPANDMGCVLVSCADVFHILIYVIPIPHGRHLWSGRKEGPSVSRQRKSVWAEHSVHVLEESSKSK